MNRTFIRTFSNSILPALLLVTSVGASEALHKSETRGNRIVGVWEAEIAVLDCSSGVQVAGFKGLHKFEAGGTAQVVPATNPAGLSAHAGVWRHLRKNLYRLEFKAFRFDPSGANLGWIVAKNDIVINDDGTAYVGSGQADVFDSGGTAVGKSCPTFTATRFGK